MTFWAYAQGPKKWPFKDTLKDPKNDTLSVCSRTQKMTLWAHAQLLFEHVLKDQKNYPLSVRSIAVWAYAQLLFEHMLKDPKNVLRAYAQGHILVVPFNLEKLLSYEEALFC